MPAILTVQQHWSDGKRNHVVGIVTIPAGTLYTTGGINLPLNVEGVLSSQPVVYSDVVGQAGYYYYSAGILYAYRYIKAPNTDPKVLVDGLLKIFSGGTELSPGAIPSAILNDVINFYAMFQKF